MLKSEYFVVEGVSLCKECRKKVLRKVNNLFTPILQEISDKISIITQKGLDYKAIAEKIGYTDKYILMLKNFEKYNSIKNLGVESQEKILIKINKILEEINDENRGV